MATLGSGTFKYEVSGDQWGDLPHGWSFKETADVAVDSHDNVYAFNRGEHPMIVFDRNGKFLRSWGEGLFTTPHGVTIGPDDSVYCADTVDHTVRKLTPEGKVLMTLGEKDRPSPPMSGKPFNKPTHLAVDLRNGDLYVSDGYSNASIHKFSPDGKLLFSWGESGTDPGQFNNVHNIATDEDGWVYVCDRENHRIQVFSSEGKFETEWYGFARAASIKIVDGLAYILGDCVAQDRDLTRLRIDFNVDALGGKPRTEVLRMHRRTGHHGLVSLNEAGGFDERQAFVACTEDAVFVAYILGGDIPVFGQPTLHLPFELLAEVVSGQAGGEGGTAAAGHVIV